MNTKLNFFVATCALLVFFAASANAKIPPPVAPTDPVAIAAAAAAATTKAEKDKAVADKTKADQVRYEDKAVANFRANLKKAGKPVPKPTPVVVAAASAAIPATAAKPAKK